MQKSGVLHLAGTSEQGFAAVLDAMLRLSWEVEIATAPLIRATRRSLIHGNVEVQIAVNGSEATYDAEMRMKSGPFVERSIDGAIDELRTQLEGPGPPAPGPIVDRPAPHPELPTPDQGFRVPPTDFSPPDRDWQLSLNQTPLPLGAAPLEDSPGPLEEEPTESLPDGRQANPRLAAILARAAHIDSQRLPYDSGGGHTAHPHDGEPLDCSGAVSKVLGIRPEVSGELERYGRPGPGRHVTIYANGEHVLMEINGRFWGTSRSNPKGGAGWIPRGYIPAGYLRGFVARHPPGE